MSLEETGNIETEANELFHLNKIGVPNWVHVQNHVQNQVINRVQNHVQNHSQNYVTCGQKMSFDHRNILPPGFVIGSSIHVAFDNNDGTEGNKHWVEQWPLTTQMV